MNHELTHMKIKVCGMREPQNIAEVAGLQPDYLGFICYDRSPRYVGNGLAAALEALPNAISSVGVFVNEEIGVVSELIDTHGFDAVQLHGAESPDVCQAIRTKAIVFKAFGIDENFDLDQLEPYANVVNYFLFDTKTAAHGGSGQTFDWQVLDNYKLSVPFLLSGGLSLDNLEKVKQIKHPAFYGVDLNSRFELEPGSKDIDKLRSAFNILRPENEVHS